MLQITIKDSELDYELDTTSYSAKDLGTFLFSLITPNSPYFVGFIEKIKSKYPPIYAEIKKNYRNEEPIMHATKVFGAVE